MPYTMNAHDKKQNKLCMQYHRHFVKGCHVTCYMKVHSITVFIPQIIIKIADKTQYIFEE